MGVMVDRADERTIRQLATIYEALHGDPTLPSVAESQTFRQNEYFLEEEVYCGQ